MTSNNMSESEEKLWTAATEAGEKFSTLYYKAYDKHGRPDLPGFYMENVVLLWNGNRVEGKKNAVVFMNDLPSSSTCIHSLSVQPVHEQISNDRKLVMVNVFGNIKFNHHPAHLFSELFFLIQEDQLWRVQSVTFRLLD